MNTHTAPHCDAVTTGLKRCRYNAAHTIDADVREVHLCVRHRDQLAEKGTQTIIGFLGEIATVTATSAGYHYEAQP